MTSLPIKAITIELPQRAGEIEMNVEESVMEGEMETALLAGEMQTVMSWRSNWEKQHRRLINEVKLSKKAENGKCEREKKG